MSELYLMIIAFFVAGVLVKYYKFSWLLKGYFDEENKIEKDEWQTPEADMVKECCKTLLDIEREIYYENNKISIISFKDNNKTNELYDKISKGLLDK